MATWSMSAARRGREGRPALATRTTKNAGPEGRRFFSVVSVRSVEQRVDVVLRGVADVAGELRAVEELVILAAGVDVHRRVGLDRVDAAPDVHHRIDVLFDELHRVHDLADALAGQVLKIAGLEDRDDAFLDVVGEPLLLVG